MVYHFKWLSGDIINSESLLGRIGVYGVPIFYIISGMSLSLRYYYEDFTKPYTIFNFYAVRILRILPLYALITILKFFLSVNIWDKWTLFINITGFFSVISPSSYIPTGGWSIGNEIVYYSIFPFLIMYKRKMFLFLFLFVISLLISSSELEVTKTIEEQWDIYINPINNMFFFVFGILYITINNISIRFSVLINFIFVFIVICLFILIPVHGNRIGLVTGVNRFLFSVLSILISIIIFILPPIKNYWISVLSQCSYSIYLLHPIVYSTVKKSFLPKSINSQFYISILLTILVSYLSYNYFEKKIMFFGKKKLIQNSNDER